MKYLLLLLTLQTVYATPRKGIAECNLTSLKVTAIAPEEITASKLTSGDWIVLKTDTDKTMPSLRYVRTALEEIMVKAFEKEGFDLDRAKLFFGLVFNEVYTNAMLHGNKLDSEKVVFLRYTQAGDKLSVEVIDEGKFYNPDNKKDARNKLRDDGSIVGEQPVMDLLRRREAAGLGRGGEGGRGVLMTGQMTDKTTYTPYKPSRKYEGTHVTLEWDFSLPHWQKTKDE